MVRTHRAIANAPTITIGGGSSDAGKFLVVPYLPGNTQRDGERYKLGSGSIADGE